MEGKTLNEHFQVHYIKYNIRHYPSSELKISFISENRK